MSVSSRRGGVYGRDTLAFPGPVVPMRSRNRAESARRAKRNKIVYAPDAPEAKPERAPPSARARAGAAATGADERAGRTACGDGRSGGRCQNRGAERRRPDAAVAGIRRLKKPSARSASKRRSSAPADAGSREARPRRSGPGPRNRLDACRVTRAPTPGRVARVIPRGRAPGPRDASNRAVFSGAISNARTVIAGRLVAASAWGMVLCLRARAVRLVLDLSAVDARACVRVVRAALVVDRLRAGSCDRRPPSRATVQKKRRKSGIFARFSAQISPDHHRYFLDRRRRVRARAET